MFQVSEQTVTTAQNGFWKIIVVDDEPSVHEITEIVLRNISYLDKGLQFINAHSAEEAKIVCKQNQDAALILLDVVMEDDDSGLQVVKYLRDQLKNHTIRIVLRTGQAGLAPEKNIIVDFDINDYKEKTELTSTKLFTTVISSLRTYKEIIDRQKAEQTLRDRKNQLRKHNQVLTDLTRNKLFTVGKLDVTLRSITTAAANALNVQLVSVWTYDSHKNHFHAIEFYSTAQDTINHNQTWTPSQPTEYFKYFDETRVIALDTPESIQQYGKSAPPFYSNNPIAVLDAPLRLHQDVVGFVRFEYVGLSRKWTLDDENFSATMSDFVSAALSNQEHEEQLREKIKIESELKTAAAFQSALFPDELPQIPHLELACHFRPASEIGGDWYGFMTDFKNHLFIMVGDVTGHGIPAALVTATASATCRTLEEMYCAQNKIPDPALLLEHLNRAIYKIAYPEYQMTFFIASINLETKELIFSNAAHNFPCIVRADKSVKYLLNTNKYLGAYPELEFTTSNITLKAGDSIIFYTDGITENTNSQGQMLGNSRFRRSLLKNLHFSPKNMVQNVIDEATNFYGNEPIHDDMTLVVCRID